MKIKMKDGSSREIGFEEELGKNAFRHTTAHILAQAVKRLYSNTICAIGPAIADGFYYDFDFDFHFSEENFAELEAEMKKIVKENLLIDYWRKLHTREGYVEISTPMMLNRQLWETSGHWEHYRDNMYTTVIDGADFAIKPMNCPGGMLVYKMEPHSYRELPMRIGELGVIHRNEKSGTLHGLMRVRCCTQDDAHIFMTTAQIQDEIKGVIRLIDEVYSNFGFKYHVELSTRPENSIGSDKDWELATNGLKNALDDLKLPYVVNEGDGAFYGPKIDFHLEDSIGRLDWKNVAVRDNSVGFSAAAAF